uniref:putative sugar nucleotidyl transferase n=1 Tax=Ornithobacterium rhinotracheale TaxID=28251 RepID=UPI0039A68B73
MNIVLFANNEKQMYPLCFTRSFGDLRMGIFTFRERWEKLFSTSISCFTADYLQDLYPLTLEHDNLFINSAYFPTHDFIIRLRKLKPQQGIWENSECLGFRGNWEEFQDKENLAKIQLAEKQLKINCPYDLFMNNQQALLSDFALATKNRESAEIPPGNKFIGRENIFVEEGAKVTFATLNASEGPIYLGKNSEIMEGAMIRGGLALCEKATIKMGAKIYGETTIGPHCTVGGEIKNVIFNGFSNKAHDGYLGNSVVGEWCNLGANTNASNLRNDYGMVDLWDYTENKYTETGLQFCGVFMGDHSKLAINSKINTGSIIEGFSNIFAEGFIPRKIPMFSFSGKRDGSKLKLQQVFDLAENTMKRRNIPLSDVYKKMITFLYNLKNNQ